MCLYFPLSLQEVLPIGSGTILSFTNYAINLNQRESTMAFKFYLYLNFRLSKILYACINKVNFYCTEQFLTLINEIDNIGIQ